MNDDRVQEIYASLESYVIELDPNPADRGPGYLQDLISKTRGYLNNTSVFLSQVLHMIHTEEMALDALEAALQIQADELLATDPAVSTLPAVNDRLAMVNVRLRAERRAITEKKRVVKNLNHVQKVVRHRQKELDNTMAAIRLQRSLLETEIRTGAFYGDENDASRGTRWPQAASRQVDDVDADEIDRLLREAEGAIETTGQEETTTEPQPVVSESVDKHNGSGAAVVVDSDEDPAIRKFLSPEDEIEELLKDI